MAGEIHVGDKGSRIRFTIKDGTVPVDLTGSTTTEIIFKKPDDSTFTKSATVLSAKDGRI